MKKALKPLMLCVCAVLLVVATVMGTLAYLTSTDEVTNTFTVGNVTITLDEADVDTDGTYVTDETARVDANKYHLLPNHEYIKDPTIHVATGSEDCYVFVKVENGLAAIESDATGDKNVAAQMDELGWIAVSEGSNIYYKASAVSAGTDVVVFNKFKIDGDVDNDTLAKYEGKTIKVTAYAIQADGFDTAVDAWNAGKDQATSKSAAAN